MIILSVYCDNLYMFRDFKVDFTYNKKIKHPLAENDALFENSRIKVRKNFVILGGNASGKTTFGKLLCIICNYVLGRSIDEEPYLSIEKVRYDKSKNAKFIVEFVIKENLYVLEASFNEKGLVTESIKRQKLYKKYNIINIREKINELKPELEYDVSKDKIAMGFKSFVLGNQKYAEMIERELGFFFLFSEFAKNSYNGMEEDIDVKKLNELLPKIDNSVEKVISLQPIEGKERSLSYMIVFKNGEKVTIPEGKLEGCAPRLSHGTFEAINFIAVLSALPKRNKCIIYIDEQLAHMHTELEAYFIKKAFQNKTNDTQLFFSTHNLEIFNLNIPNNSFVFFNRNDSGYNEMLYPSEKMCKNDRNLRNYYENDYFGVLPDYSTLDETFESENENG